MFAFTGIVRRASEYGGHSASAGDRFDGIVGCWDLDVGSLRKPATQDRRLRTLADNLFDTLYATGLDLQWQASAMETCMQHPLTTKAAACQATLNLIIKRLMIIVATATLRL